MTPSQFEGFSVDPSSFPTWWGGGDANVWKSQGCGNLEGICAIAFELDISTKCDSSACGDNRAFRLSSDAWHTLWTCAKCTPFNRTVIDNPNVRMNCSVGGTSSGSPFTPDALNATFPFLYDASILQSYALDGQVVNRTFANGSTAMSVLMPLEPSPILQKDCRESPWQCFAGYDPTRTITNEDLVWDKALSSPLAFNTMSCDGQRYTADMQSKCNPRLDRRRKALSDFIDEQYRQTNGLRMHQVCLPMPSRVYELTNA